MDSGFMYISAAKVFKDFIPGQKPCCEQFQVRIFFYYCHNAEGEQQTATTLDSYGSYFLHVSWRNPVMWFLIQLNSIQINSIWFNSVQFSSTQLYLYSVIS